MRTRAGPGQIPAIPQPVPNNAAPANNFKSNCFVSGSCKGLLAKLNDLFLIIRNAIALMTIDKINVIINPAFHSPKTSKKERTLLGL